MERTGMELDGLLSRDSDIHLRERKPSANGQRNDHVNNDTIDLR